MAKKEISIFKNSEEIGPLSSHLNEPSPLNLFERSPSQEYLEEWTENLKQLPAKESKDHLSVLIFRLGLEWLALATVFIKEVTHRRPFHQIPHRSNKILLGVVNLNGELQLYVALNELLGISLASSTELDRIHYKENRMIAIAQDENLWVFPVEEIDGIYNWDLFLLENVPVNISKSSEHYIKGIVKIDNKSVGLLDESLLFSSLRRSISESL